MHSLLPYFVLALAAGFCLPTQAGINARLNLWTQSPVLAAAISFAVGTLGLIIYALILRVPMPACSSMGDHPWWVWSGGLLGAFLVAATVVLAPKLSAGTMVALIVTGQMVTSIVLDHFGLVGYPEHPLNALRLAGVVLLVSGVALISNS
jgi:transporter family-2 protein